MPGPCSTLRVLSPFISVEGKYREAMKHYLDIGAMTSNMFSIPVPFHAWDEQVQHFVSMTLIFIFALRTCYAFSRLLKLSI